MRIRVLLNLMTLFLFWSCQQQDLSSLQYLNGQIIGGEAANITNIPWQVSIRDARGQHFCGGSIISKRVVITAAHCLDQTTAENVKVAAGGANGKLESQRALPAVQKLLLHEGWTGGYAETVNHDIALIIFKSDIMFDRNMHAIALPDRDNFSYRVDDYFTQFDGELMTSGWGDTKKISDDRGQLKKYSVTPLASALDAGFWTQHAQYKYIVVDLGRRMLGGNFLVSYTTGKSTCGGDSGGPLVLMPGYITTQPILIGLTSAGGDGGCSSSVFHTNVQKYLGWIKAQI